MSKLNLEKRFAASVKPSKMNLTPLIDIFTVILIFLVFGFSPEDAAIDAAQRAKLPTLETKVESSDINLLSIRKNKLYFNREELGELKNLSALSNRLELLLQGQGSTKPTYIQADKNLSFKSVDLAIQVMRSSGISKIQFLGIKEEE